ncbi:HTH-type transcriptional regulator HdfR [Cupriavidus laharis]|uniref:HTH-type transcriptional regulator HdfR n=1 Tax=Cupriavidus laharis TaxID=151654 RepID=A0ABM8XW71_9BURK|nr:LysR family transcriptional regulator [Cupriavidus laharis]CAG9184656.1 HTH-type transcriptional regulator HdfR [Cupriavidus laharis]
MHDADWDDLRYFLAVSRAGSLAGAARTLQVNHSTVLRRLASLEDDLGTRLFDRHQGGYALTAAGEALATQLTTVGELIDAAQRQLGGLDAQLSGTLRITTTDTLLGPLLMPMLAEFRGQHPRIQLQVAVNNTFLNLSRREADIAVRPAAAPPEHLVGRLAGLLQTAPYAARSYLRQFGRGRPPRQDEAWDTYDWVVPDDALSHLAQARWVAANVPEERRAVYADSLVAMAEAVRQGMGAGMLLCLLADPDRDMVRLAPPDPALDTPLWILTHPDLRGSARVRAFSDFLLAKLQASPWLLPPPRQAAPARRR